MAAAFYPDYDTGGASPLLRAATGLEAAGEIDPFETDFDGT